MGKNVAGMGDIRHLGKIRHIFKAEDHLEDINVDERMIFRWSL
jgi:hypothetical protein